MEWGEGGGGGGGVWGVGGGGGGRPMWGGGAPHTLHTPPPPPPPPACHPLHLIAVIVLLGGWRWIPAPHTAPCTAVHATRATTAPTLLGDGAVLRNAGRADCAQHPLPPPPPTTISAARTHLGQVGVQRWHVVVKPQRGQRPQNVVAIDRLPLLLLAPVAGLRMHSRMDKRCTAPSPPPHLPRSPPTSRTR
jgi:hypothetical protein